MRYILVFLTLILVPATFFYVANSLRMLYIYHFTKVETTKGVVRNFERYIDYNGVVAYRYSVDFFAGGKIYNLKEQLSPDSLIGIKNYDTIALRYVKSNPNNATIKRASDLLNNGLVSIIIVIIEIFMIWQSVIVIKSMFKKEKLPDNFWGSN